MEKVCETWERITALSFKGNTKTRIEEPEKKKKKNEGQYEHFFTDFYFFGQTSEWFIVLFLYALLICYSCC